MQEKMVAPSGICLTFLVLVLCLSHGSWSAAARLVVSDEVMPSESKMQLVEHLSQAASEPIPPHTLLNSESVENSNQPLEVVHGSLSPTPSVSNVDQIDWSRPIGRVAVPVGTSPIPFLRPPPNPACQPACAPSWYPPQPTTPTCQPNNNPACAPSWYPPQPTTPTCQPNNNPACAPSWYPPQPTTPTCQPTNNPACQPACAPSWYPPQPNPTCQPACTPNVWYPPQTNPGCVPHPLEAGVDTRYPPQHEPSDPFGPRINEEDLLKQGNDGQSSEVEIVVADNVEEDGVPKNEQDSSNVITPSTT